MQTISIGKKKIVVIPCKTLLSKAFGLMFSKKKSLFMIFDKEQHIPLHMWFVFFPIDVIFFNKHNQVVEIKEDFLPFTFYTPKKKAKYVLEAPAGIVKKYNISMNTIIKFQDSRKRY